MQAPERKRNPLINSAAGGRTLSALQLPFFRLRPPRGYGLLTTTGRKSGKSRQRCVRAIHDGEKAFLVAIKGGRTGWARNVEANPEVRLRIPGGAFAGVARQPRDEAERRQARDAYCERVNPFDYPAYAMWRSGRPTPSRIRQMLGEWFDSGTPLVVELRSLRRG